MRAVDLRPDAELQPKVRKYFPYMDLRGYQADLANRVYDALCLGGWNIVVKTPTGLGRGL